MNKLQTMKFVYSVVINVVLVLSQQKIVVYVVITLETTVIVAIVNLIILK